MHHRGEADHVHLLLSLNPKVAPSVFVNNLKELKRYYWNKPVFWSRSYCIISCSGAPLSVIQQYIEQQEAPH